MDPSPPERLRPEDDLGWAARILEAEEEELLMMTWRRLQVPVPEPELEPEPETDEEAEEAQGCTGKQAQHAPPTTT